MNVIALKQRFLCICSYNGHKHWCSCYLWISSTNEQSVNLIQRTKNKESNGALKCSSIWCSNCCRCWFIESVSLFSCIFCVFFLFEKSWPAFGILNRNTYVFISICTHQSYDFRFMGTLRDSRLISDCLSPSRFVWIENCGLLTIKSISKQGIWMKW